MGLNQWWTDAGFLTAVFVLWGVGPVHSEASKVKAQDGFLITEGGRTRAASILAGGVQHTFGGSTPEVIKEFPDAALVRVSGVVGKRCPFYYQWFSSDGVASEIIDECSSGNVEVVREGDTFTTTISSPDGGYSTTWLWKKGVEPVSKLYSPRPVDLGVTYTEIDQLVSVYPSELSDVPEWSGDLKELFSGSDGEFRDYFYTSDTVFKADYDTPWVVGVGCGDACLFRKGVIAIHVDGKIAAAVMSLSPGYSSVNLLGYASAEDVSLPYDFLKQLRIFSNYIETSESLYKGCRQWGLDVSMDIAVSRTTGESPEDVISRLLAPPDLNETADSPRKVPAQKATEAVTEAVAEVIPSIWNAEAGGVGTIVDTCWKASMVGILGRFDKFNH